MPQSNKFFEIFSEKEWGDVLAEHPSPSDVIKEEIWDRTREHGVPTVSISENDAESDFRELRSLSCLSLIKTGDIFSRYDYKWDIGNKYIDSCNTGNKSSNFYHQELRFKCDSINAPSPHRTWTDKKFFFTLLNGLWTLKFKKVDSDSLRQCIALRKYIASQFRPSAAKAVYEHFKAENVLDFSSGWGDRLTAAMATDFIKNYVGIDPNKDLIKNYASQISKFGPDRSIAMISAPAEEALDNLNYSPDLVFTSPPYFIIERYSKDKSQSWQRYKKLGAWLDKFLFPCIEKSWNILVSGGHMAINISDVYCNHTINKICDPMNDFISTLPSAEKIDNLNYKMAKRLNSKSDKTGIFVEPVWCWRKN